MGCSGSEDGLLRGFSGGLLESCCTGRVGGIALGWFGWLKG